MSLVLGIDAAWSEKNPSGVALVSAETRPPRLIRASPSFEDFILGTTPDAWCGKYDVRASLSDVLTKSAEIGRGSVTVMAVDMPLSLKPVRARRCCDDLVSRTFGARGCPTHSPTEQRPGRVADEFLKDATAAGFSLRTRSSDKNTAPALLEVYPHVALLELCQAEFRLPYKFARRRRYWPRLKPVDGREEIRREWDRILSCLKTKIDLSLEIDCAGRTLRHWKAWEDVIDAMVCCWVGLEWLSGRAKAYGDDNAAIWVPETRSPI